MSILIAASDRLQLRNLDWSDLDFLFELFNDSQAMKYYPSKRDREKTKSWMQLSMDYFEKYGHAKYMIIRKTDGQRLGHCGLLPTDVDGVTEMELGYFLHPSHWGQGYATEASQLVRDLAFGKFGYKRIISAINPLNISSIEVAKRLGLSREKVGTATVAGYSWEAEIYSLSR